MLFIMKKREILEVALDYRCPMGGQARWLSKESWKETLPSLNGKKQNKKVVTFPHNNDDDDYSLFYGDPPEWKQKNGIQVKVMNHIFICTPIISRPED